MKTRTLILKTLLVAALLGMAVLVPACAKKGVALRFNYIKGKEFKYHLVSKVTTRMATDNTVNKYLIEIDMVVRAVIQSIKKNGDAEMAFTYEKISYINSQEPEKSVETIKKLKNAQLFITLTPYGEIVDFKGLEDLPHMEIEDFNLFKILMKAHPIFPYSAIPIGKKWDRQQEFPIENALIKGNMLAYKRFVIMDTIGPVAKINSEITMKFDLPEQKNFSLQADEGERLGFFGNGNINFDINRGEMIDAKAYVFGKMILTLKHPVTGDPLVTRIETTQNIDLAIEQ
ncbi:MAG: hypothetical protein A2268_10080 [Candidatus Raymondbacteria bacterium RifOxyA12_full_50_37]|uniref:Uncharacterized protein n=1 Tax=Candidatus Raymondbacteria bacterium RIFOXYD12_FULL_49_13 TaxID=1817890 RepID=A0A1F7F486_UNCRA|nr:MAG: hypothetical protein A2268_10080 [Candidatus Raymondbacteria bacterium RifOxyA12_full_50_37]OGJ92414.1 MAG: hypothetical protein A2350_03230 [Candidatus Raymondbacteria bacterium RifOxyB12_full_50_8]OGJ93814.1 MAG: hypothetical protein A2248_06220 [Candidatus Raymondbacteria bacterium RIFOXYA2_FULL_49_16]OGJ94308.1 MAG: hypothetical protein A2487_17510 [Candidatus Raymondbacteria bacterium RifOxyC12_full_50_8]OGJ98319.1 MAG: hypothetical protein A2453_00955 [Candidatus Raymondbacteria b